MFVQSFNTGRKFRKVKTLIFLGAVCEKVQFKKL